MPRPFANLVSSDVTRSLSLVGADEQSEHPKGQNAGQLPDLAQRCAGRCRQGLLLQLPRSLCAGIHEHLSKYILRSKVKIEDVSDQQISFGWAGEDCEEQLREHLGSVPIEHWGAEEVGNRKSEHNDTGVIRLGEQRFQINTTIDHAIELWQKLIVTGRPVGSSCWDWLSIQEGIPASFRPPGSIRATNGQYGTDWWGQFQKRMLSRPGNRGAHAISGKLKKRMYLAHVESSTPRNPG